MNRTRAFSEYVCGFDFQVYCTPVCEYFVDRSPLLIEPSVCCVRVSMDSKFLNDATFCQITSTTCLAAGLPVARPGGLYDLLMSLLFLTVPFCGDRLSQKVHWTNFRQIFRVGRHMGLDDQSGIRSVCDRSRDVAVVTVFGSNRQRLAYLTFIIRTGIAKQTEGSQRL